MTPSRPMRRRRGRGDESARRRTDRAAGPTGACARCESAARCRPPAPIRRSISRVVALIPRWTFLRICVKFRDFATKVWPRPRWGQSVLAFARPARRFTPRRSSGDTGFRVSAPGSAMANAGGIRSTGSASRCPPGVAGDPRSPDAPVETAGPERPFRPNTHLPGDNMLKKTRLAALAAVMLIAAAAAVVTPAVQAQAQPAAPRRHRAGGRHAAPRLPPRRRRPRPRPGRKAGRTTEVVDNPYGLESLWRTSDAVAKATLTILVIMSIGSWYIIVTKIYEQYKLGRQAKAAEKIVLGRAVGPAGRRRPEEDQPVPVHRRVWARGFEQAHRVARQRQPERLDVDVDPARDRQRRQPHAGRPRVPRHRRLDRPVRRAVRNGLGHLPRADRHRHRRPGVDRQGRRPGGRGADHDRDRPRRRGSRGARLQLAGPPQQGGDGARAQLRRRPARGPAVRARSPPPRAEPWP